MSDSGSEDEYDVGSGAVQETGDFSFERFAHYVTKGKPGKRANYLAEELTINSECECD